jgi:transposase InsO family protein
VHDRRRAIGTRDTDSLIVPSAFPVGSAWLVHCLSQLLDQDGISDDIHLFNDKLREWEDYYNYHRPHGAPGGQTPYERLLMKTRAEPSPKV